MEIIDKNFFIKHIKSATDKPFKIRFIKSGKYGKPECWIYPINNPKQQKQKFIGTKAYNIIHEDGSPVMESKTGLLITQETVADKEYLKEYLISCF